MRASRRPSIAMVAALGFIAAAFLIGASLSSAPPATAGAPQPGLHCSEYTPNGLAHTCVIDAGDNWFCEPAFMGDVCQTVVEAGDTVIWDFTGASLSHTATECGDSCDAPTMAPFFDSGTVLRSRYTLPTLSDFSMELLYHCQVHPEQMKGMLTIVGSLPAPPAGDVNCNSSVNSIDAALVLQLSAGLVASLPCQQFADVNEDGNVNSIDSALILQFAAGLLPALPV